LIVNPMRSPRPPIQMNNCYRYIFTKYLECFQTHVCISQVILAGSILGARA
jgi:hypothetical protein